MIGVNWEIEKVPPRFVFPPEIFSFPNKMDLEDFETQQNIADEMVDCWVEKKNEKEIKRMEKLTPEERMREHLDRIETLREAEKNNWN